MQQAPPSNPLALGLAGQAGEEEKVSIGERVKTLRKRSGLTQKEFAARMAEKGDCTHIGKIERDDQYPSIKFLKRIGDTFSVPLSYFFQGGSQKPLGEWS